MCVAVMIINIYLVGNNVNKVNDEYSDSAID